MAKALKPGAPLAFTYHHNKIGAYYAVGIAILDAGLTCSVSLPCPAEMAGSIHIRGTVAPAPCRESGFSKTKPEPPPSSPTIWTSFVNPA